MSDQGELVAVGNPDLFREVWALVRGFGLGDLRHGQGRSGSDECHE
jgi:hypothetical protein